MKKEASVILAKCAQDKLYGIRIEKRDNDIYATSLVTNNEYKITNDTLVSMNMMSFTPNIFKYIEDNFKKFLDENKDNLDSCEYLIPSVLSKGIKEGYCNVSVIKTNSKWVGVTYKEDKKDVVEYIKNIVAQMKLLLKLHLPKLGHSRHNLYHQA